MEPLDKDIIIIPDVHGREFWRPVIGKFSDRISSGDMHCVFLGDYVDPYDREISAGNACGYKGTYEMLCEIVALKERFKDNLTLLLGNHDLQYIDEYIEGEGTRCRYMWSYASRITNVLRENWDKFSLAYEVLLNTGRRCLMTHAGVMKAWVDIWFDNMTESDITAVWLNSFLLGDMSRLYIFDSPGTERGGRGHGSPVWADVEEFYWGFANERTRTDYPDIPQTVYTGIYQVFAHTILLPFSFDKCPEKPYIVNENYAMLDAQRGFIMHPDGTIEEV